VPDQEVGIRVDDEKIRFNELKKIIDEKCQSFVKKQEIKAEIQKSEELPPQSQLIQETKLETDNGKPYTGVESGVGYFKFYKQGGNIKIGKENTRSFKLLRCLTEPQFGIQKTIEAVFEAIKLEKDDEDSRLSGLSSPARKTRILEIIDYTKKELQKNKALQGKITYCMDKKKEKMWLK
jgi:hypothetical protein